jgi:hypothetical protein
MFFGISFIIQLITRFYNFILRHTCHVTIMKLKIKVTKCSSCLRLRNEYVEVQAVFFPTKSSGKQH